MVYAMLGLVLWWAVMLVFGAMYLYPETRRPVPALLGLFWLFCIAIGVFGCTSQQVATITTDAATVCADISAVETAIGPLNLVPIVSTTEAYLGDACSAEKIAAADVPWLISFAGNLKATVAAVKLGKVSP